MKCTICELLGDYGAWHFTISAEHSHTINLWYSIIIDRSVNCVQLYFPICMDVLFVIWVPLIKYFVFSILLSEHIYNVCKFYEQGSPLIIIASRVNSLYLAIYSHDRYAKTITDTEVNITIKLKWNVQNSNPRFTIALLS